MNLAATLMQFYTAIADDGRIGTTHISLYVTLLQYYKQERQRAEVQRRHVMIAAKISARQTYNKCMKELQQYGYIAYTPSKNGYCVTLVEFISLRSE